MKALDKEGLDYLANKVYDAINSGGSADYIVEEGTSGVWTYRKWASGIAECWFTKPSTGPVALTTVWVAPVYYSGSAYSRYAYPTGLFIDVPTVHATLDSNPSSVWLMTRGTSGTQGTKDSTPAYQFARAGSIESANISLMITARGFWKEFTPSTSRLNPLTEVLYSGAWTATRTSANGVALTDTLTIPNGYYIIIIKAPNLVTNAQYSLKASVNNTVPDNSIAVVPSHGLVTFMMKLTNTSNTVLGLSAQSAQQDFTLLERGGIYAMRIANS